MDGQGWGGCRTHGCGGPGTHQAPPVPQESEDDDEEEEEEEDDDEDEDDDDDNGDSSEEGGDSSESSSEEESEDGDEVRLRHGEGTGRARGPPHPPPGLGGTRSRAQIDPWWRSPREAGGHGEEKGNGIPPVFPGRARGAAAGRSQEQPRDVEVRGVCRAPSEQRKISCLFPGGDTESGLGSVCASVNAE